MFNKKKYLRQKYIKYKSHETIFDLNANLYPLYISSAFLTVFRNIIYYHSVFIHIAFRWKNSTKGQIVSVNIFIKKKEDVRKCKNELYIAFQD